MSKEIFIAFIVISAVKMELPLLKNIPKTQNCSQYTSQLSSLLTLMCNNIALNTEDDVMRDACIGCFQQASTVNNNEPSLSNLRSCAENYLTESRYEECTTQIDMNPGTGSCVTGYCKFVTCIRRINSDLLIAQCFEEAAADNDAEVEEDQVILFKNITSCILARTRCSTINAINGQRQVNFITQTTYGKWGKPKTTTFPVYNSLQITPEGNLRLIRLPGNTIVQNHFCTSQPNLKQSSWLDYSC